MWWRPQNVYRWARQKIPSPQPPTKLWPPTNSGHQLSSYLPFSPQCRSCWSLSSAGVCPNYQLCLPAALPIHIHTRNRYSHKWIQRTIDCRSPQIRNPLAATILLYCVFEFGGCCATHIPTYICLYTIVLPKVEGAAVTTTVSSQLLLWNRATTKNFTNFSLNLQLRLSVGAIPAAAVGSTSSSSAQIYWYLAHSPWYLIW